MDRGVQIRWKRPDRPIVPLILVIAAITDQAVQQQETQSADPAPSFLPCWIFWRAKCSASPMA